jgi:murein DD-endopeptidase MepM/ murein hydrolase activator NlpD
MLPPRPKSATIVRTSIILALLLHAAAFAFPDYWWQGPVSHDVTRAPEPGPRRRFFLLQEIGSIFSRAQDSPPALDLAARPAEVLALLAFALLLARFNRLAITTASIAIIAWLNRPWTCNPHGFLTGYYAWLSSMAALIAAAALRPRVTLGRRGVWARRIAITLTVLLLLAAALGHILFTGPADLSIYPPPQASCYRLPFPAGVRRFCIQGNRGGYSHRGWQEFAWDFCMPVGSDVCAARAGVVARVEVSYDGHGLHNNEIIIDHRDGTFGFYLHLMKGGSYVRVGQRVGQGQRIAASGDVGYSTAPHLHFQVGRWEIIQSPAGQPTWKLHLLPVTFADVATDHGIPRSLKWYTSGNAMPTP